MARISLAIFIICFVMYFALAGAKKKSKKVDETINSCPLPSDRVGDGPLNSIYLQKLDHFDSRSERVWCQRYFKDNTYFKRNQQKAGEKRIRKMNKPVFFMVGGNEPLNENLLNGMWKKLAETYKALRLYLENRFYGLYHPIDDFSTENLMNYLSIDQSLADNARFIMNMKKDNLHKNKWIVFGVFYGGTLAAWLKHNYPGLLHGAVASSAIFPTKPFIKGHYQRMGDALESHSSICADEIKKAIEELSHLKLDILYCIHVQTIFKVIAHDFCLDPLKQSHFFQILAGAIGMFVISKNIDILCDEMTKPFEDNQEFRLANAIKKLIYYQTIDVGFESILSTKPPPGQILRQWQYQQCTEFGGLLTSESPNQPFFNHFGSEFLLKSTCTDIFGEEYDEQLMVRGINNTIKNFGGLNTKFNNTIFFFGTESLWYESQMQKHNKAGNVVINIEGGFGGEEMESADPTDSEKLKDARELIEVFFDLLMR